MKTSRMYMNAPMNSTGSRSRLWLSLVVITTGDDGERGFFPRDPARPFPALRAPTLREPDRRAFPLAAEGAIQPDAVAQLDAVDLETRLVAGLRDECVALDGAHPEAEPLIEPQVADVCGRGR